ncbi:MAG TPA: CD225/dispanin family protein [Thermoanaerobaculia bacterium]|nr:CD225/dispanin family protein [Thermoanaerobaculia bacterium]
MNCPNCGSSNLDNATICVNCGRPLTAPPPPPPPPVQQATYIPPPPSGTPYGAPPPAGTPIPNYLVQSILVTLCCCLPLGVVAIVFAAQVNSKLAAGDIAGAREASNNARKFCWIAFLCGIAIIVISMLINGAVILQGIHDGWANR